MDGICLEHSCVLLMFSSAISIASEGWVARSRIQQERLRREKTGVEGQQRPNYTYFRIDDGKLQVQVQVELQGSRRDLGATRPVELTRG